MKSHLIAFFIFVTATVAALPALAKPIDLTSGRAGSVLFGQTYGDTRGVEIRNLSATDWQLASMTLNGLNISSSATVAARVYRVGGGTLIAGASTTVAAGSDLSVTIPISAVLDAGSRFRLCFYVTVAPGATGTFFNVTYPYTELVASSGNLQVVQAYTGPGDAFPTSTTGSMPLMVIDVQGISDPTCFTDAGGPFPCLSNSAAVWGDYDNDGDQDVLITGWTRTNPVTRLYRNDGGPGPTFTDVNAGLVGVFQSAAAWGDYDNDGDLDLFVTGNTGTGWTSKLYRNSGGANPTFTDSGVSLIGVNSGSVAWGDYDNDGDLDLVVTGNSSSGRVSKLYRNNGGANPTFFEISAGFIAVSASSVAWADYDKDGDLDLLLTGDSNPNGTTRLYRNGGAPAYAFSVVSTTLPDILGGSVAWGDYDNDGDLDILMEGRGSGAAVSKVFRNSGGGNPTFTDISAGLTGTDWGSAAWGDYDSDGDLDILLSGGFSGPFMTFVYRNNGGANPTFSDTGAHLSGLEFGTAAWGDADGDGDLDVVMTGALGGEQGFVRLYKSTCTPANTPPSMPTGLTAGFNGNLATFTWNAATDAQTPSAGLSYNIRIGTTPGGSEVVPAMANGVNGYRRIPALGNRGESLSWSASLPGSQTYYWSVQSIDGSFAGSAFATEQHICGPSFPGIPHPITGVAGGPVASGDYDNDGDMDLYMSGTTDGTNFISRIYRKGAGLNQFTDIAAGIPGVVYGSGAWGDCDGDGDLDLVMTGIGAGTNAKIWRNSGGANPTFSDMNAGFFGLYFSASEWGDYDNDGDLDLVLCGYDAAIAAPATRIFRNSGGPNPTFSDIGAGLTGVYYCAAAWADYDKDGDLDLLISGQDNASQPLTRLYRNSGGANPTFTDAGAGLPGVYGSSVSWGDYDSDGDLDILLAGDNGATQITRVYRNSGGPNPTFADAGVSLPGDSFGSASWGDYDNDGDLDILLIGQGASLIAAIYQSSGGPNPSFTDLGATMFGVLQGGSSWNDFDGDGDLDVIYAGHSDASYSTRLHRNTCAPANTVPDAPTNLQFSLNGNVGTFSWNASSDSETPAQALSYNLRVGTAPGLADLVVPLSDVTTGKRQVQAIGNAGEKTSRVINLPGPGPFYWSVQAIDGEFAGSPFAPEQSTAVSGAPETSLPANYSLAAAGPNPFTTRTALRFSQPTRGLVSIEIFDVAGRRIKNLVHEELVAGSWLRSWDGRDDEGRPVPSGLYFARMTAGVAVRSYRLSVVR